MKTPSVGGQPASAAAPGPRSKKAVEPTFQALGKMPETPAELFDSLALTASANVEQTDPSGKKLSSKTQHYALPWAGYTSWRNARERLTHFEDSMKGAATWAFFNDSDSNDGPMSLNAFPGRAFIERVTNGGDANLDLKAIDDKGPMPSSPAEAAGRWFGLGSGALSGKLTNEQARDLAQATVRVTAFVGDPKDSRDCIIDARDFGIGLSAAEMPGTILSLNRGLKKKKPYLTGKHGQGASSTYQYSDLTLIASRKAGAKKVAFTLVEGSWMTEDGVMAKTPTYRYLVVNGKIPEVEVTATDFHSGTLVRHIGYMATDLFGTIGADSLYGLLMRSLAEPVFPVWFEMHTLRPGTHAGYPTLPGFRRYGRLIAGTVNALDRAWNAKLKGEVEKVEESEGAEGDDEGREPEKAASLLHKAEEYYTLPKWDIGGRDGIIELGRVKFKYWVAEPAGRTSPDVLKNWVDPDKTILMTLDGQTHAEESRAIITGTHGAKLWAVGKYMVIQIDCNELDQRAKYQMFTSTREHAKETPIKKMILEELVRRLTLDPKLAELNTRLAAADIKRSDDGDESFSKLIKKYLKAAGVSFEQLTRKVEKWVEVDEEKEVRAARQEPTPIEAQEPPTFVRWKFKDTSIRMYPGQRYSYVFETDAMPSYWNPGDPTLSKIKVLSHTIHYVGSGEMRGGRVRCHFECPQDTSVGTKGFIQVQLDYALGEAKTHRVPVEVVEKPTPRVRPPSPRDDDKEVNEDGPAKKTITIKVQRKDFTQVEIPVMRPVPVTTNDPTWATLGWPHDPARVGFSIRQVGGRVTLYYNAEFPPFLELRRKLSKRSLDEEFRHRYETKLVLHTIFSLNYDLTDEDDFAETQRKQVRSILCATAESLALATKSEIEIEAKIKSEDPTPMETSVAADLEEARSTHVGEAVLAPAAANG